MDQQTGTLNGCFSYYTKKPKHSGKTPLKLSKILAIVLRETFLSQPAPPGKARIFFLKLGWYQTTRIYIILKPFK